MTNTIYQNLCDRVGAYKPSCNRNAEFYHLDCTLKKRINGHLLCPDNCEKVEPIIIYPEQSANQRERLEELILSKRQGYEISIRKSIANSYGYEITARQRHYLKDKKYSSDGYFRTRLIAIYALIHKLLDEGVLNEKEVYKALK